MAALIDFVDERTTIVTVNQRLARGLLTAYGERAMAGGRTAWRTPDVLPYAAFIRRAWGHLRAPSGARHALLSDAQERLTWEAVIRAGPLPAADDGGFSTGIAARQAQAAFALLNAWRLDLDHAEFGRNEDSRAFRAWARVFVQRCDDGHWIDAGRAANALADAAPSVAETCAGRIVFAGFEVLTAQHRNFMDALRAAGADVIVAEAHGARGDVERYVFDDITGELTAAAGWARATLASDAEIRIGVIVPDLHLIRDKVERIFEEALCPGRAMPGAPADPRPFNLSLGAPLSRVTVIGDALLALELGRERFALESVGRLLRSPYLRGAGKSLGERARLDARLRDIGEAEISLETLIVRAAQTELHDPLRGLQSLKAQASKCKPLAGWSRFFTEWLQCLGWPGDRGLDSDEFQAVEAFHGLLDEVARCGGVAEPQAFARAHALLRRFADEQIFQPRGLPAPVQIVGALEATGQHFDGLWVCALTDGVWPPPPDPNPFLPVTLQRRAGIPQSSPETQLALARERLDAWFRSAPRIIVSHARMEGDEPLRASPLIASLPESSPADLDAFAAAGFTAQLANSAAELERLSDAAGPAFPAGETVHAGAAVFSDQAACPFRAFAHHRLGAASVAAAASPFDARVRGILVHRVLFDFWSEIRSQQQLLALSAGDLQRRIGKAVDRAIERERRMRPDTLRGALAAIERTRLTALVGDWIESERSRAPFEPAAREEGIDVTIGGLSFTVRPDRADRLESGDYLLVDYKTGDVSVSGWFGERPDDPQLAIYSIAFESAFAGSEVAGAAYGVLRRDLCGFRGYAARDGIADGIGTLENARSPEAKAAGDWHALKRRWQASLDALANEFVSGDARVAPKRGAQTCRRCDAMPLCRVFETEGGFSDGEGGA
jgi:probable DNA repair protein